MFLNDKKIGSLALFIITLISIVLLTASLWNALIRVQSQGNIWSIIFLFVSLVSSSTLFIRYLKETNSTRLENIISMRVEEERLKIYDELNKKDEIIEEEKVDVDEIVNKIIPKGNFKNIGSFSEKLLQNMGQVNEISQGIFYLSNKDYSNYTFVAGYALTNEQSIPDFKPGENLNGQVAVSKEILLLKEVPNDYMNIESGLGKGKPVNLYFVPVLFENNTIAVIEFATFKSNSELILEIYKKLTLEVADKLVQMQKSSKNND
jgi:hypothetical protein